MTGWLAELAFDVVARLVNIALFPSQCFSPSIDKMVRAINKSPCILWYSVN